MLMNINNATGVVPERKMSAAPVVEKGASVKLPIIADIPELEPGIHVIKNIEALIGKDLSTLTYELDGVPVGGQFDLGGDHILSLRELVLNTEDADGNPVLLEALVQVYVATRMAAMDGEDDASHWLAELDNSDFIGPTMTTGEY